MRYQIVLEGGGGELDREELDTDDENILRDAMIDLVTRCTLAPGDTIRIIDTKPE